MSSSYQKYPYIDLAGTLYKGWPEVIRVIRNDYEQSGKDRYVIAIETYQGIYRDELYNQFSRAYPDLLIDTDRLLLPEERIRRLTFPDVTDDRIFGYITRLKLNQLVDWEKAAEVQRQITGASGLVIIYGYAASLIAPQADLLIYADMARWEIQLRQRRHEVDNLGLRNRNETPAEQYKRGFFVDWRICDRQKKLLFEKADYWLDMNRKGVPHMITASLLREGLKQTARRPFRVVPFFDPGPWGGHWMQERFDLNPDEPNFAWGFDCVPEENSLLFCIQNEPFEIPAINLVLYQPEELLGGPVYSRFGAEFPIRFDFLDTMGGGNLSLQVHPTVEYIREHFGMHYTQDESYYILDAGDDACVYLGLKDGIDPAQMIHDLRRAQQGDAPFDVDAYINRFPAEQHDHFLIPAGTVHCAGANTVVLEISATPYIFTFKLWDWNRLGLDGKPRPINIDHGEKVIDWRRTTEWCREHLVNRIERAGEGNGWLEDRTGLHENEFIETRCHCFFDKVKHFTGGGVNVLNLVNGKEVIVESPEHAFEPFIIHYAETFIIPASIPSYTIRPHGIWENKLCETIKASVRFESDLYTL
jgi:hypothetical protein